MKNLRKIKNVKGITLVSLVITIIVILILSAVTIGLIFNNRIIDLTQEAGIEYRKSEIMEKLQLKIADVKAKNLGKITIENYLQEVYKENIVEEKNTKQIEEKSYNITSRDGYIFNASEPRENVIEIKYIGREGNSNEAPPIHEEFSIDKEFSYTGSEQVVELKPGTYDIECYGAERGHGKYKDTYKYEGGKGAYTKGTITLTEATTLYLYVGGQGGDSPKGNKALGGAGGYNGGGTGGQDSSDNDSGGGGGGATDIRLVGGNWDNIEVLISRIIVAEGGSGSSYVNKGQHGGT